MAIRGLRLIVLIPFALSVLSADVTVRYKTEVKMNMTLPGMPDPAKVLGNAMPHDLTLLEKDGKAFSGINAGLSAITDFTTKKVVLLDVAGKRYAKIDADKLGEAMSEGMPQMPTAATALLSSLKMNVSAPKSTGRTETIQGVEAEEHEMELTMDGPALLPGAPPGPMVREVIQFWLAKPSETLRVPAIRELTGYAFWSIVTTNPAGQMEALFKQMPGMADGVNAMLKNMQNGVMLRMHVAVYMPLLGQLLGQARGANNAPQGFDPNAPLMQINQEVAEISSAPVASSQFEIPDGFQEVAAADIIKAMVPPSTPHAASLAAH
jgi:hypothetical protein